MQAGVEEEGGLSMVHETKKLRVAVIQDSPVIMDKEKTLFKVGELASRASKEGAELILFPEAFIPCYPRGLSFGAVVGSRKPEGRKDWARYYENSISINGPEVDMLKGIAEKNKVYLAIGVIEKETGSLYCSLFYFGPDGAFLAGPVWDKEDILLADLDLNAVIEARFDFDVCGHYSRPDVFTLLVNEQPDCNLDR